MKVVNTIERGQGIVTDVDIPAGSFVCEYPGRLLAYQVNECPTIEVDCL